MSKTIYIGGRLESKEKGNVVTGANAILDDTKGKKQNVINKETDDELARLEQSKQDNLNFDSTPTEDSTNPVTSGGVYTAEKALSDAIEAILLLIPSAATALNKLVDTNTMNSSISTATATFRGTYNAVSDLGLTYQATHAQIEAALDALGLTADNNDFAFVQIPVSDQSQDIAKTERFKFNGTNWLYEYDLNTSGFTAAQWAAINSTITLALVQKLTDLPTAAALQLALNAKQDTLTFDNEPTALSQNPVTSGGIYNVIQAVATALSDYSTTTDGRLNVLEGLVPTEASSINKLTDKAYVDGLIQAITELIPAEADTTNQLADKAYVLAQILAAAPAFKGQFTTLAELQAVASPSFGDLGIVRTKDSDGMDVFTVYQYLNNAWNVFYSLSYHPQTKPATTGTTGDYPYNGMGRVELAKNMVNTGTELAPVMVNQLTQDMFYKGSVGARVPNTNTIFVIRYDYVLGEDITIPANCVLEFDGGSITGDGEGKDTLNGTSYYIVETGKPILNYVKVSPSNGQLMAISFGISTSNMTDNGARYNHARCLNMLFTECGYSYADGNYHNCYFIEQPMMMPFSHASNIVGIKSPMPNSAVTFIPKEGFNTNYPNRGLIETSNYWSGLPGGAENVYEFSGNIVISNVHIQCLNRADYGIVYWASNESKIINTLVQSATVANIFLGGYQVDVFLNSVVTNNNNENAYGILCGNHPVQDYAPGVPGSMGGRGQGGYIYITDSGGNCRNFIKLCNTIFTNITNIRVEQVDKLISFISDQDTSGGNVPHVNLNNSTFEFGDTAYTNKTLFYIDSLSKIEIVTSNVRRANNNTDIYETTGSVSTSMNPYNNIFYWTNYPVYVPSVQNLKVLQFEDVSNTGMWIGSVKGGQSVGSNIGDNKRIGFAYDWDQISAQIHRGQVVWKAGESSLMLFSVDGDLEYVFTSKISGTTTYRPTSVSMFGKTYNPRVGLYYFDTTLGKPIFYAGNGVWVDATGTPV